MKNWWWCQAHTLALLAPFSCMLLMILFQVMNYVWLRFCVTIFQDKRQTWVFLYICCAKVALFMVESCFILFLFLIRIIQKSYVTCKSWRPWCIFCLFKQLHITHRSTMSLYQQTWFFSYTQQKMLFTTDFSVSWNSTSFLWSVLTAWTDLNFGYSSTQSPIFWHLLSILLYQNGMALHS